MASITNVKDLLPLLGAVATSDDPIAALERGGTTFSNTLKTTLRPHKTVNPQQRKEWAASAKKGGRLTFTTGKKPLLTARQLAPGEFEFSAGVRMPLANQILGGLLTAGTIPDTLFLDELLSAGTIDLLQGAFVVDRPGGRISRMQITGAPTIAAVQDGRANVALTIPFRLNFERITNTPGGQIRTVVTFATGRLRLIVGLVTRTVPVSVSARNLEIQIDLSASSDARLEIDANSPLQRTSPPVPGQTDGLGVLLQNAIQQRLAGALQITVSAGIPLPIGKLEIRQMAILTRGDALLVGVKVQGTPGTGDPNSLVALFPTADSNFFTRVHDQVLRLIVQSAARSGELTRIAKKTHSDAVIDSADVSFGKETINLQASGKIVDLCPLGVDLGFTVTVTVTVTMEVTRIKIEKKTEQDLDNLDAFLCVVTSLGLALLAAIGIIVFNGIGIASGFAAGYALGVVGILSLILEFDEQEFDLVFGDSGPNEPTFIELDFPFPGTDLLPTLTGAFLRLDESTMLAAARLGVRADVLNTYFYVRFLEADALGIGRPMKGATVKLMDRDSPAPAGDDVTFPNPSTRTTSHQIPAGVLVTTIKTRFERTADEAVREATADHTGRVRMYIPHDKLANRAGTKVVETTRTNLDTDQETTGTARTAVSEAKPDFYFRVTRANGSKVDTLQIPAGFFLNFTSRRVGTPANPLTITFGGGSVIVADPILHL